MIMAMTTVTSMQWRSVDRVAEHVRQREEQLEDGYDGMDFETRAAALEAYFLGTSRCGTILSGRKSPRPAKAMRRVRPQSASYTRRNDTCASSHEMRGRQRPQSAKYRSQLPCDDQNIDRVDWNAPTQSKTSKWREMLARGPEFEQLSLRKLELETYELLSRTYQQRREVDVQPSARRRRKGKTENNADSNELARGSGLHLARSRKKRQQEHDREMMLGKGRRRSEREKPKDACEGKTAIADKTRRRGKLLKKTTMQKPHQEPAHHVLKQDKKPQESYLQRPSSAHRARGPWIPFNLSSSVDIRYASSGNREMLMAQDKRIAKLLEAFQRQAGTLFRTPKNAQKQLKKTQQRAKTTRRSESQKAEQTLNSCPESNEYVKGKSPSSASASTLQETAMLVSRGNQEDDVDRPPVLQEPTLFVPNSPSQLPLLCDIVFSTSPATPTLVIPPLKLPPNLWDFQQSRDAHDELSERSQCHSHDYPSIGLESANPVTPSSAAPNDENSDMMTSSTTKFEGLQADGVSNQTAILADDLGRRTTIEDGYLAESLAEQASTGLSSADTESSPTPQKEFLYEEMLLVDPDDGNDNLAAFSNGKVSDLNDTSMGDGEESTRSSSQLNEVHIVTDTSTNPTEDIDSQLPEKFLDTTEALDGSSPDSGYSVKEDNEDTSNTELQSNVEHNTSENQSSTTEMVNMVDNEKAVGISEGTVERKPCSGDVTELIGYSSDSERRQSARVFNEPAIIHDVDPKSVAVALSDTEGEQDYSYLVVSESLQEIMANEEGETTSTCTLTSYDHLPESEEDAGAKHDLDSDVVTSEQQLSFTLVENSDVSFSANSESNLPEQYHDLDSGVPNNLPGDSGAMMATNDVEQFLASEITGTVVCGNSAADAQLEDSEHHSQLRKCGEYAQTEPQNADASNALPLDNTTPTMLLTQPESSPGTLLIDTNERIPVLETKFDIVPTKASSRARSPKKKTKKTKATVSVTTPKKNKPEVEQSSPSVAEITTIATVSEQNCSPAVHCSDSELAEEDPLRLHQQELTRSFLKRVSSRKLVEPEAMSSIQAETPIEQVECDDILGSIESVTATAVKESDSIDGDSVSLLKRDFSQMLNNCESDMEKYPPAMEITLDSTTTASTEKVDMATDFASVNDDSVLMLAVVNDFGANPETTNDNLDVVAQEPVNYVNDNQDIPVHVVSQPALTTPDNLTPDSDAKEIADKDPTVEHHNVARKIQVQYRCFVRRRIILDQLRFILTKQRRKARKSRHKVKKANAFDNNTRGEKESAVVHVTMDATSMDNVQEEVQQVASTPMSSEIGFEVASTARSGEAPEPSEQTMKLGARKGSCEYVFDLFDTQEEAKGEEMQEAIVSVVNSAVEDKLSMTSVSDGDKNEPNLKKLDDQQHDDFAALPEKDVMIASTDATKCLEVLPVEEDIVFEGPVLLPSKATQDEVHSSISTARADAGGLVTSMMLTELAFTTVEQEPRVPADTIRVEDGAPQMQQHWERYVDSTTNKSFYYNPSTNETQWTAPTEDRDYAAINSSRVTPTTPRTTVVTATDAVSPSGHFLSAHETTGTWQEFLDEATGHLYYYNTKTGECSWEPPASRSDPSLVVESLQSVATAESTAIGASPWVMYIDPASQVPYYVNTETLATSWEQPQAFAVAAQPTEDKYVIAIDDHAALQI